jgi:germination protein M
MIDTGMKKKKRVSSRTLGCLFWATLAVVLVAVALAVRDPVMRNLRAVLGRSEPGTEEPAAGGPGQRPAAPAGGSTAAPAAAQPVPPASSAAQPAPSAVTTGAPATPAAAAAPASSPPPARTRSARLWFAKVDEDGAIELAPVSRSLPVGDSPLRDNLVALLAGPTAGEAGAGVVSFLPAGTSVRSVTVKGDIATIDFSEQFRFNTLGIDGLRAQLRQVVWAATEFPTVSRVQVLIEGRRVDFLAPEGAAVGFPLGRDSDFQ